VNSVLRKVARGLKYRLLPELIGTKVTIESVRSVPFNVVAMLDRALLDRALSLPVRFSGPQEHSITVALAKYRILDLRFTVDGVEWQPKDTPGISLLKEFGFILKPNDILGRVRQSVLEHDDPTCINFLDKDIGQDQTLLRLYLEEVPRGKGTEYLEELTKAGKRRLLKGSVAEMELLLDGFFPHEMAVSDACLTNADSIWFHKHFYM
jgi:hypothetical protein